MKLDVIASGYKAKCVSPFVGMPYNFHGTKDMGACITKIDLVIALDCREEENALRLASVQVGPSWGPSWCRHR